MSSSSHHVTALEYNFGGMPSTNMLDKYIFVTFTFILFWKRTNLSSVSDSIWQSNRWVAWCAGPGQGRHCQFPKCMMLVAATCCLFPYSCDFNYFCNYVLKCTLVIVKSEKYMLLIMMSSQKEIKITHTKNVSGVKNGCWLWHLWVCII